MAIPPLGEGSAAPLDESKQRCGITGSHNGEQGFWGCVPGSRCPCHQVVFRERTSRCSLHLPRRPWVKHPTSVELAPHHVPVAGAVWLCTGDPPTPRKITRGFKEGRQVRGSHARSHTEKTRAGTATAGGCAAGRVTRGSAVRWTW